MLNTDIYGVLTTNQPKVFNKVLKGSKLLSVMTIAKLTFIGISTHFVNLRVPYEKELTTRNKFATKVRELLKANEETSGRFEANTYSYEEEYNNEGRRYTINLVQKMYDYGELDVILAII